MSKAFRFRLDVALAQRKRQEQGVQIALSRALQGRAAVQEAIAHLAHQREEARRDASSPAPGLDIDVRMNRLLFLDRLTQRIYQQQSLLSQWDSEVQRVQLLAVQAAARRKALEKLRERRAQEYHDHEQHLAEQELDELVTLRYARALSTEWDANDTYRG